MTFHELNQLRYARAYVSALEDELHDLRAMATSCTANSSGMPGPKGLVDNKLQTLVAKIADLEEMIKAERDITIEKEKALRDYINSIDDLYIKGILTCRYIRGMTWTGVAIKMTGGICTGNNMIHTVKRYLKQ